VGEATDDAGPEAPGQKLHGHLDRTTVSEVHHETAACHVGGGLRVDDDAAGAVADKTIDALTPGPPGPPRPLTKEERAIQLRQAYEQKVTLARQIPNPDERQSALWGAENWYRENLMKLMDD